MAGKHTNKKVEFKIFNHNAMQGREEELEAIIKRQEREIEEIKIECADQFKRIKDLCFVNDYGNKYSSLKKIEEIASDNFNALVGDLGIFKEPSKMGEIIELSTTRKSR